jgi:hypothetical protein
MNRRLAALCSCLALAACARPVGQRHPQARASGPVQVATGEAATFTGSCEGCRGTGVLSWSFGVGPTDGSCRFHPGEAGAVQVSCRVPGAWIVRLDVDDALGPGEPDFADLTVTAEGPDSGLLDEGSPDAGPRDAGAADAGSPGDAGSNPLSGTLLVLRPDGNPASRALPGDLLELHAESSDPQATTCTFDALPLDAETLPTSGPCLQAVVPHGPSGPVRFGVTLRRGSESVHLSSVAIPVEDVIRQTGSLLAISTIAADPVSGLVIGARPGHSALLFDAPGQLASNISVHFSGLASAGGGVVDLGWRAGNLGRAFVDGGLATAAANSTGDLIATATLAGSDPAMPDPLLAGTDGSTFVAWSNSGALATDPGFQVDGVERVASLAGVGAASKGLLTLKGGSTLSFLPLDNLRAFAEGAGSLAPLGVNNGLGITNFAIAATAPGAGGTAWLGADDGVLYRFVGTLSGSRFDLPSSAALTLPGARPINDLAVETSGPYVDDLWIAANGNLERVTAVHNNVGAPARRVVLRLSPTINSVDVDLGATGRVIYLGTDTGLFALSL